MKTHDLEIKLVEIKKKLDEVSKVEGFNLVAEEIKQTVYCVNDLMRNQVKGHARNEKIKVLVGKFPIYKWKKISVIADTRLYSYFLSANTHLDWYLAHFISFDYNKTKITENEIPIIKSIIDDSSVYRSANIERYPDIKETRNTTILLYPLNIAFYYGDDLQDMDRYTKDTKFRLESFNDYTNMYKNFYFDFKSNEYRQIKDKRSVKIDFMPNDAKYHLNKIPEFGYLYELGRLNLDFEEYLPNIIKKQRLKLAEKSSITDDEYNDYVRYMMVAFSKDTLDVQQEQIELVKNKSYVTPGERYFIVNGTMGISVSLQKYGSNNDRIVQNDRIVEASKMN